MDSKVKVDLILKLGGSAITEKETFETLKPEALKIASQLIRKCFDKQQRCIVVHGAGSFGHHQAKQFSVISGFSQLNDEAACIARMGFCQTHRSVIQLNNHIVNALLESGCPAISCTPCGAWLTSDRVVTSSGVQTVVELLEAGFIPLLHGDTVRDTILGGSILSGDTIIKHLCSVLSVNRVVFLTDVGGIYDKPPNDPGAQLLPDIGIAEDGSMKVGVTTSISSHDVTGGIQLKLQTAANIVLNSRGRTRVFVCKLSEHSIGLCLGEGNGHNSVHGTKIHLSIKS